MAAIRVTVRGRVQGVAFRDATLARARALGVLGWVRNGEDGETVLVHAEGDEDGVEALLAFLRVGPPRAAVRALDVERVKVEGHEQFAVRGVPAGAFSVVATEDGGYELALEVAGGVLRWALRKEPSMDPAVKRLAVPVDAPPAGGAPWDTGTYEQGGRVAWPGAVDCGHAVFVLHGERLRGGFALQRTRPGQWLLIKRRDDYAVRD